MTGQYELLPARTIEGDGATDDDIRDAIILKVEHMNREKHWRIKEVSVWQYGCSVGVTVFLMFCSLT